MTPTEEMVRVAAEAMRRERGLYGKPTPSSLHQARVALTAALAAMWQPIETAKQNGRPIFYTNGAKTDATFGVCIWSVFEEDDYAAWWDFERDCEACPKLWAPVTILPQFFPAPTQLSTRMGSDA